MTFNAGGPLARSQAARARRSRGGSRGRLWLIGVVVVIALLVVAGNGGRSWWARRLGGWTHGSHVADFFIGMAVGLLPVICVAIASLRHGRRRGVRMFLAGAAGFVATDLLAPSLTRAVIHSGGSATQPFEQHVPGYLPGVYTATGIWLLLLIVAILRLRRSVHRRFDGIRHI